MDINIGRITSTVETADPVAAADSTRLTDQELDRLAAAVLQRLQRLAGGNAARSLAPDDPAGELGSWGR